MGQKIMNYIIRNSIKVIEYKIILKIEKEWKKVNWSSKI